MRCQACGARFQPGDRACASCGAARGGAETPATPRDLVWAPPAEVPGAGAFPPPEGRPWLAADEWVLVGEDLVSADDLEGPAPTPRRRRWPAVVGLSLVLGVLAAGARLGGDVAGPLLRVLPSGDARALADGITRAPTERWRTETLAGRQLTAVQEVGDRLLLVAPAARSRQGQDLVVLRTSDGAQVWNGSTVSWSADQPSVAGTTLVFVDRVTRRLRAVDLLSGADRWTQAAAQFALVPVGRDDVVLAGSSGGLSVRRVDSGAELWRPGANRGGAALRDALVLVEGTKAVAYDWLTGAVRWSTDLGAVPTWLDGAGDVVLARVGDQMIGLGPDGAERWRRPWTGTPPSGASVLPMGKDALLAVDSSMQVVDTRSGRTVLSGSFGSLEAVLTRDDRARVFVRTTDSVAELDLRTGASRRTLPDFEGVLGVSSTILYGVTDDELRGYELSSLQQLWRVRLDEPATLVSAGSVLVLRTGDGVLRALA